MTLSHRIARRADVPALKELMTTAIRQLQRGFLAPDAIEASFDVMGLDTQLIDDGTYFVIEQDGMIAAAAAGAGAPPCSEATILPGAAPRFSIPRKMRPACARCTRIRHSRAVVWEVSFSSCARARRGSKASRAWNWRRPWRGCRSIAHAAIAR